MIYFGDGGLDLDKIYVLPASLPAADRLAPLRQLGIEYVVLKRSNTANPEQQPLEDALARDGRKLAEFTPYRADVPDAARAAVSPYLHNTSALIDPALERPGPTVEIWSIARPGEAAPQTRAAPLARWHCTARRSRGLQ